MFQHMYSDRMARKRSMGPKNGRNDFEQIYKKMEQQYSTKPTILNKHLAEEIGRKAPLSSKLPHQVSEPRIVTHQRGYGGFHTK